METLNADERKERFRKFAMVTLEFNVVWNLFLVGLYSFVVTKPRWSDTHVSGLSVALTVLMLLCVVYVAACVTLRKKEYYMLTMAMIALRLDMVCLIYVYYKIIDLNMVSLWQNSINEMDVELFWREIFGEVLLVLLVIVLMYPLFFKFMSIVVLCWLEKASQQCSFYKLPSNNDCKLHSSSAPLQEVNLRDKEYSDCPLPPYSKHPVSSPCRVVFKNEMLHRK